MSASFAPPARTVLSPREFIQPSCARNDCGATVGMWGVANTLRFRLRFPIPEWALQRGPFFLMLSLPVTLGTYIPDNQRWALERLSSSDLNPQEGPTPHIALSGAFLFAKQPHLAASCPFTIPRPHQPAEREKAISDALAALTDEERRADLMKKVGTLSTDDIERLLKTG